MRVVLCSLVLAAAAVGEPRPQPEPGAAFCPSGAGGGGVGSVPPPRELRSLFWTHIPKCGTSLGLALFAYACNVSAEALGLSDASVATVEDAQELIQTVDKALEQLGEVKADFGATEVKLTTAHDRASGELISKQNAISNLRDTDLASASTGLAQELVLAQAQVAMRAQSNASASVTLKLLG